MQSDEQEIRQLVAIWMTATKLSVVVTPRGSASSMARAGHTLSILKKQNGRWVLARDANMLTPVSKSGA